MSDQHPPVPDPAQPDQPRQPAPPQWQPGPGAGAPAASRSWWSEATSTGGGRAALVGVAVLAVLFLVTGLGLATALVLGHARGDDRGVWVDSRGGQEMGPGQGRKNGQGNDGKGNGNGNKNGQGNRGGTDDDALPGRPMNPGNPANPANPGMGLGRGAAGLGAVLHGEFTTTVTGTPTVMVVQTGQVTSYTAGKSLAVKSTDGYEATYVLDATTATVGRGGAQPANGVQVRVLAVKDGMKVTTLVVGG